MSRTRMVNVLNGSTIAKFASISLAAETVGVDPSTISKVANGHRYTTGGFGWSYANSMKSKSLTVEQIDKNTGEVVAMYKDLTAVSVITGISVNRLSSVVNVRKSINGYMFRTI